jgi:hypothetical protein
MKLGFTDIFPQREIFQQLSEKFNGRLEIHLTSSNILESHSLYIPFDNWEILLTQSDTKPLKFEINFDSLLDYNFVISLEDTIDKIFKFFGVKEIEIGNKEFDSRYLIESNDFLMTSKIFSKEIAETILKHNLYSISYLTDESHQTSKLLTVASMTIDSAEVIADLIYLHFNLIKKLKDDNIINRR